MEEYDPEQPLVQTKLWIYDTTTGGSGATEQIYEGFEEFVRGAIKFASACPCDNGCPRCTTVNGCGQRNVALNKLMGLKLLSFFS
jgi:DEAD/DEAH box helicase domain-containing protein